MDKKSLEKSLLQLQEENKILKEENAYLKFELEELRLKQYKIGKKSPKDKSRGSSPVPK